MEGFHIILGYINGEKSLAQNIDDIFFAHNAKLEDEFDRLFSSVFDNSEFVKSIVSFLSTKNFGYTRAEITKALGITDGNGITKALNALIANNFIIKYVPFGLSVSGK